MKKITHLLVAFSLIGTLSNGIESAWAKTSKSKGNKASGKKSGDETVKKLLGLKAKKAELVRKRKALTKERTTVANRLENINDQLSKASVAKAKRSISDELVVEEVNASIDEVELDILILELDKSILSLDEQIFKLEKTRFQDKYSGDYSLKAEKVEKLPDENSDDYDYSFEKDLLAKLEPAIFQYWGNKRNDLNQQILKSRKHRLELWGDELRNHKAFLEMKKEDFKSGKKRGEERQNLLRKYFSLRNSRLMVGNELIRLENESWQAGQELKYELGSLYRRLTLAKRVLKGRDSSLEKYRKETFVSSVNTEDFPDKLKVNEYTLGLVFSDVFNWGTTVFKTVDDTSADSIGIKSGDEIVSVDNSPVIGSDSIFKSLLRGAKGNSKELIVLRSGNLYKVDVDLDFRPEEKSHPQIIKSIKSAEEKGDSEKLVTALMDELSYVSSFSRELAAADPTCEQLLKLLEENKSLSGDLRVKAYVACSIHSLSRMGQCLSQAKRGADDKKTSESATFMNQADDAANKAVELASPENRASVEVKVSYDFLKLANEYRKHYDFKHIGSKDMLEKTSDAAIAIAKAKSQKSPYIAASVLCEIAELYELSLKNYKKAGELLEISLANYVKALPEEAREITDVQLLLSRNLSRAGNNGKAIGSLEQRLATIERINSYSRKAEETGMYDYVATLKELGRLYDKEEDFEKSLNVASKILDTYKELDAVEDYTYVEALLLAGRSSLETGKAKKAIVYLTDAMERLESKDKTACLIALAKAYQSTGKTREAKLFCSVLRDYLKNRLSDTSTVSDGIVIGDQAVEVAQVLDSIGEYDSAVSLFDFALLAYTARLSNLEETDDIQARAELKKVAEHLSKKLAIFNSILDNAGNQARASSVGDYSKELKTKLSSGEEFEIDWLVRVP